MFLNCMNRERDSMVLPKDFEVGGYYIIHVQDIQRVAYFICKSRPSETGAPYVFYFGLFNAQTINENLINKTYIHDKMIASVPDSYTYNIRKYNRINEYTYNKHAFSSMREKLMNNLGFPLHDPTRRFKVEQDDDNDDDKIVLGMLKKMDGFLETTIQNLREMKEIINSGENERS